MILSNSEIIYQKDLPNRFQTNCSTRQDKESTEQIDHQTATLLDDKSLIDAVNDLEKAKISKALQQSGGVKTKAAKILGISRYALLRKLNRYNI